MHTITLYDTTLRDGAQTEGISYSVQDKLRIAERLDAFGLPYIEGGWPGSNPKDLEFFATVRKRRLRQAQVVAFGSTRHASQTAARDPNVQALLKSETSVITIFGKTWDLHVREVLRVSPGENLRMIEETVAYLAARGRRVIFDAEHFFDGYKADPAYALKTLQVAVDAGAETLALCDTNGGSLTTDIRSTIEAIRRSVHVPLGIHVHNDCNLAVANSVAAVEAGCTQVQGTINGYGERCGNANLVSVIAVLKTKLGINCLPDQKLKELTETSRFVAEVSNVTQHANQPFVGESAFAHKGGVHVNAVLKHPHSYEHIEPAQVGNQRRILVSELGGKTSILVRAQRLALDLEKTSPQTRKIHKLLQQLEHEGYHFEAAEGSFELLLARHLKQLKPFFKLEGFRVIIEKRPDGRLISEAAIKVRVDGVVEHTASEGDGPVNALDNALRKALEEFYPKLSEMHLTDFKVRVLDEKQGTAAKVRVLIESQDAHSSWGTVGVSENIIEASWQALVDSVEYKLLKDKKVASGQQPAASKKR